MAEIRSLTLKASDVRKATARARRLASTATTTMPAAPPPCSQLLTKPQIIQKLKSEIALTSLTDTAEKYHIKPQQLSDIMYGRANLSKKALAKLKWKLWEFYEKVG